MVAMLWQDPFILIGTFNKHILFLGLMILIPKDFSPKEYLYYLNTHKCDFLLYGLSSQQAFFPS